MQVIKYKKEISQIITQLKSEGKTIGFVPTMGALHEGHLSLIRECRKNNTICVVSIFVNPTQFNDKNDLQNYPRMPEKDFESIEKEGCDLVFYPDVNEIYPEPDLREFDFGGLDKVMEGKHRPGHFNGVAQVVTKLFEIVQPHNAYFGEKDFQQLAIIKFLVQTMNLPVKIVPCSIVREPDGLAMSSRNLSLGKNERVAAPLIAKTLFDSTTRINSWTIDDVKNWVIKTINENQFLKVEYFEIVDGTNLQPVINKEKNIVGCIAVKAGNVRLIDNIGYN